MPKDKPAVPVVPTAKAAGHASNARAWSKPSSFFKDRRRQQSGGFSVPQTGTLTDLQTLRLYDLGTIRLFHAAEKAGYYDDENMLLERLIQLLYKLPRHSRRGKLLTDAFITKLWSTLDHPQPTPIPTLMGQENRHRTADGSNSNPYFRTLGAAGTPYARSVAPMDVQSPDMPDPGLIFDTLLSRNGECKPHQCGISSMMFYLGVIITHDIFQTGGRDGAINLASSYLDLAPLYGNSWEEQKEMRQFRNGLLKPDCFAHKRLLTFPPACRVFLVMFNRFHNYVVEQLASINEANRFKKPTSAPDSNDLDDQKAWEQYDEDLFQTGRLVTCGLYVNIILKDYVRAILCLNRTDSTWTIDPRTNMDRHAQKTTAPTGVGNQVSVEFNLLYRWHSILSSRDAEWIAEEMRQLLDGSDPETATFHEMITAFQAWETALPTDPHQRDSVPGLQRQSDGAYSDDELVDILRASIEDTAGSFGANSVPRCLRPVEMLGILQARRWRVCTLNEFRAFIGLTRHRTFEDINPDPAVAASLKSLYGSPANVELYPGLMSEKTKPPMAPGSGVCLGFTSSRAILSDAVSLVRGDRFYTDDFTPKNLTNWGFAEVDSDFDVDSGNVMYKLIFCAFPHHFQRDSIYAHHPLVTPAENKIIFEGLKKASEYTWDPPSRHANTVVVKESREPDKEAQVSNDHKQPDPSSLASPKHVVTDFVVLTSANLLKSQSYGVPNPSSDHDSRGIDVVSEVINSTFVRLTAEMFSLSLKATNDKRRGAYTDAQLGTILSVLYAAESPRLSLGRSYELQSQARDLVVRFRKEIPLSKLTKGLSDNSKFSVRSYGQRLTTSQKLRDNEKLADRVATLVACSAMVPVLLLSESLDYQLNQGPEHMEKLRAISQQKTDTSEQVLLRYLLNGCSLRGDDSSTKESYSPTSSATSSAAPTNTRVLVDYFPEGTNSDDVNFCIEAMAALFKIIVSLPGLRRAPGAPGHLASVPAVQWHGQTGRQLGPEEGQSMYMTSDRSSFWPVPVTMNIVWDSK
ncbi:unnamed protein product [Clonostachys rhizophaga]|uniref:Psi-producing oxygenase A n=1 Tax=Clonostachys rhizophaga TaxID=160324 RepID=A0A9N9W4M7_9HYPO|nr:unnamed protein product [Clonostachys rhizophaga]